MLQIDSIILARLRTSASDIVPYVFQTLQIISCNWINTVDIRSVSLPPVVVFIEVGRSRVLGDRNKISLRALFMACYSEEIKACFQCCPWRKVVMQHSRKGWHASGDDTCVNFDETVKFRWSLCTAGGKT